ncbi:MAG: tetratricopeptide repeat protein [Clostridiales bacterium]|nr:tetratricopeptide repeat protein [Clostridiales bacterium]
MQLQIKHISTVDSKPLFVVIHDGKQSSRNPVPLTPPWEIPVRAHTLNLQQGLCWYLEDYIQLPGGNFPKLADDILASLADWGRECFDLLFCSNDSINGWYRKARQAGLSTLCVHIVSDDPEVLSWPWEALESKDDGILALQCRMERTLDIIGHLRHLPDSLPKDKLNILYIIANPFADNEHSLTTLARPLTDLVKNGAWPVHIDLLRPPTFKQLQAVLEGNPNFYHIVHFDGHSEFQAPLGKLFFTGDNPQHRGEPVLASKLGQLLRQYNIPLMVLNASQPDIQDDQGKKPLALVAARLLKAGLKSIAVMSNNISPTGAKIFINAFYRHLFQEGNVSEAMWAARQEMYNKQKRDTLGNQLNLQDWLMPLLYLKENVFLPQLLPSETKESCLPVQAQRLGDYGFIGRNNELYNLEKMLKQEAAGILIHGRAGEGKTTLVKGFLRWLEATHGLGVGVFWFSFEDIHSMGYIINTLSSSLFGQDALTLPMKQKLALLAKVLRENPFIIIWDDCEAAAGIMGNEAFALLFEEDRKLLIRFLNELHGGKTKVIISSRNSENWLGPQECCRLPLNGLRNMDLAQYCNAVIKDLKLTLDQDMNYKDLLDKAEGNALALRVILQCLTKYPAKLLLDEWESAFNPLPDETDTIHIEAVFSLFEGGLDSDLLPALRLLGLHGQYADTNLLNIMLNKTGQAELKKDCLAELQSAGLCDLIGNDIYRLHPALREYLGKICPADKTGKYAFVEVMVSLADTYIEKELPEQRYIFQIFSANFKYALNIADELALQEKVLSLLQSLASYAHNTYNFSEEELFLKQLAETASIYDSLDSQAAAYHQLGMIAQKRRDFTLAESWYKQSLTLKFKIGQEQSTVITYHQLGLLAQEQWDLNDAENWFKQSLAIELKIGNERGLLDTYHKLGRVAQERRNFADAENWYKQSLTIKLKLGDEQGAAVIYCHLGQIAQERHDFAGAEAWFKQSLTIELTYGAESEAAYTYYQLGKATEGQRDFEAAQNWYQQALACYVKQGNEYGVAQTYYQLGKVTQEQQDLAAAENYYKQSLSMDIKLNVEHNAAQTCYQLGVVAEERSDFRAAEDWYKKALNAYERLQDQYSADKVLRNLQFLDSKKKNKNI